MNKMKRYDKANLINGCRGIFALFLVMIVLGLTLTSCGEQEAGTSSREEKKEYEIVNKIDMPIHNISTLNPVKSNDEDTYFISKLIYDGLYTMDETMTPKENLAESCKFNKDEASATIDLIDTTFHDGKSLKASDVVFSVQAYKAAGKKCQYKSLVSNILRAEASGKHRVKIYFSDNIHMSLDMLTFPILPSHRYDNIYTLTSGEPDFKPVGTGKYRYKSYNSSKALKLKPNNNYHGRVPENSLTFTVVSSTATAYQLVEASSLSALVTRSADREARVAQKEQQIYSFPANEVVFVGFNFNKANTYEKSVRKAIAYAIDTQSIIEEVYMNSGVQNDCIYYPGYLGTENKGDAYKYNPGKAEKILKKAGFKDMSGDGYLQSSTGGTLTITMIVNGDNQLFAQTAELVKEQLEEIGIFMYISKLSKPAYKNSLKSGNFDIYVGGYKYDEIMDMRPILQGLEPEEKDDKTIGGKFQNNNANENIADEDEDTDEDKETRERKQEEKKKDEVKKHLSAKLVEYNYIRYYNGKVNSYMDKLKSGLSAEDMKATYLSLKKILKDELPYYCLLQRTYGMVGSPSLDGTPSPVFDNYYNGIENLRCKFEKAARDEDEGQSENQQ